MELRAGGEDSIEIHSLKKLSRTVILTTELEIPLFIKSELDVGEASVIHAAVHQDISLVAIDEKTWETYRKTPRTQFNWLDRYSR